MQQGSTPVYPVGHCPQLLFGHPPKQRGMPALSRLQTSFWPSQQACDAFTLNVPPSGSGKGAPQMLPTGLQACPLSQRPYVWDGSLRSHITDPFGLVPPPQHDCSSVQARPVMMQPEDGVQTVAPVPGSAQMRVQQVELPEQGIPFWLQPPGGRTQ